ncbi:MAG: CBS domain-containing protein [Parvibaculaceae bacterium]|nr:CBS domain-containing protein [Parvibaculaceae bacterium]
MQVASILKDKGASVITIAPSATIADAVRLLNEHRIGAVIVMENHKLRGIISERDIVRSFGKFGAGALAQPVESMMTTKVITCSKADTADDLMDLMTGGRFRHVPVLEHGEVIGIISIGDVVKHRFAEKEMETEALKLYIANS